MYASTTCTARAASRSRWTLCMAWDHAGAPEAQALLGQRALRFYRRFTAAPAPGRLAPDLHGAAWRPPGSGRFWLATEVACRPCWARPTPSRAQIMDRPQPAARAARSWARASPAATTPPLPDTLGVSSPRAECVQFGGCIARRLVLVQPRRRATWARRGSRPCAPANIASAHRPRRRHPDQATTSRSRASAPRRRRASRAVARDAAVDRYRAAVRARGRARPDFVIVRRQCCCARDAANGGMHELVERLNAQHWTLGGVDWVQLEPPHSIDEILAGARRGDRHALRHAVGQACWRPLTSCAGKVSAPWAAHRVVHVPARPGPGGGELDVLARLQRTRHRRLTPTPSAAAPRVIRTFEPRALRLAIIWPSVSGPRTGPSSAPRSARGRNSATRGPCPLRASSPQIGNTPFRA